MFINFTEAEVEQREKQLEIEQEALDAVIEECGL
jgi:hypothetical protein